MHEDASHQPVAQVPQIASPNAAHIEAANKLREDRLNARAHSRQDRAVEQPCQRRRGPFVGRQQADTQASQDLFELGQPGVAVTQQQSACAFDQIQDDGSFSDVACRQADTGDDAWPAHPHMDPKARKRLLLHMIPSTGRFSPKHLRAVGTDETADRQRKTVDDCQFGIAGDLSAEQPLPQAFFDGPQIGGLPHKGGAVQVLKGRKERVVMALEVRKQLFILGQPQVRTNDCYGNHLALAQFRLRARLPFVINGNTSSIRQKHAISRPGSWSSSSAALFVLLRRVDFMSRSVCKANLHTGFSNKVRL